MENIVNKYQKLIDLQKVLLKQNIPFVSYRLPLETKIVSLLQQHSAPEKLYSIDNINTKSGFIISAFDVTENSDIYLLTPDCVCYDNEIELGFIDNLNNNLLFLNKKRETNANDTTSFNDFTDNVNKAVDILNQGVFNKVVLSKTRREDIPEHFEAETIFLKLCQQYPHAFVYLLQMPEVGIWMGASPEPLITVNEEQAITVSVAGTQVATNLDIDAYCWGEKEVIEQKIVSDFVNETLLNLGTKNITVSGPFNYQAANLIHLKTVFKFPALELKNKLGLFLNALHPTPSVGGLPKAEARKFILANEKHDRAYYTGFLGPVNIDKNTNVFVNLRCLQLLENQLILYSGAGITAASVAENEWTETENKMLTLLNVINE